MTETMYLVLPCYNEEEILPYTVSALNEKMNCLISEGLISENSKVLFVNDGSSDNTWNIITEIHNQNSLFTGISLAHNSGEQNAYIAGITCAKEYADFVITADADLQDDINAVDEMILKHYNGCDIVYGVRNDRGHESKFKKFTANAFYSLMSAMGTELVPEHSQYRLMSKRVLEALGEYGEVNMFLPALIPLIGFKSDIVFHKRSERVAGKSNYNAGKLLSLAIEAITSFSTKPIKFVSILALVCLIFLLSGIISMIITKMVTPVHVLFSSLWAVGFLILVAVRIIGEYIGKIYSEVKKRPRYIIEKSYLDEKRQDE